MKTPLYRSIFNDVFGPIMIGASSGGFGGPNRIGNLCRSLYGGTPGTIEITYQEGSSKAFARTAFGSDIAMISGLLGHAADSPSVNRSWEEAKALGIRYTFKNGQVPEYQTIVGETSGPPDVIRIVLSGEQTLSVLADSIGGGALEILSVNGFRVRKMDGDSYSLLIFSCGDTPEEGDVFRALEAAGFPLEQVIDTESSVSNDGALLVIYASVPFPASISFCETKGVISVLRGDPVLPVVTPANLEPPLFTSILEFNRIANSENLDCAEVAILYEMRRSHKTRDELLEMMHYVWQVMQGTILRGLAGNVDQGKNPFSYEFATKYEERMKSETAFVDGVIGAASLYSVAAFEGIADKDTVSVAGPAAGAPVIIGASIRAVSQHFSFTDEQIIKAMFVAAAYGLIAYIKSNPTAEVTGCSGESGVGSAMAAAALAYLGGGSTEQIENAASTALMNMFGMGCDPIAGGVCGAPCRARSTSACINAIVSADTVLAGYRPYLPYDEAIDAMDRVFSVLPAFMKGRGNGGVNESPSSLHIAKEFEEFTKQK